MYAAQGPALELARRQARDVLLRVLREREPELGEHLRGVAAAAAGHRPRASGLDAEELDVLVRAAELHDVGKIAIPDAILHKPGPLDAEEWELMRTPHDRSASASSSAAPAMRAGRQARALQPRALGRRRLPRRASPARRSRSASRIVFVCDAYDAMTEARSYRASARPGGRSTSCAAAPAPSSTRRVVELFAEHVYPSLSEQGAGVAGIH